MPPILSSQESGCATASRPSSAAESPCTTSSGELDHEVLRVREVLSPETTDVLVLRFANDNGQLLVTCNRDDFVTLARTQPHAVIVIISRTTRAQREPLNPLSLPWGRRSRPHAQGRLLPFCDHDERWSHIQRRGEKRVVPAITDQLSDQELTDIYAYLRTIPRAKNPAETPLLNQLKSPGK